MLVACGAVAARLPVQPSTMPTDSDAPGPDDTCCAASVRCTASDLLRWTGLPALVDGQTDGIVFPLRRLRARRVLIHEGQPFETLHVVAGGSFKAVRTDPEGYEQVLGFAIHGDFLGLDGLGQTRHHCGAVALEDATAVSIPWRELLAWSRAVPALGSLLHHAAGVELLRRGDTQYLMSAPSAEVRVVRFLLQAARRQAAIGQSTQRLRLRMTRRDIGSYLGVAHESVSRALGALARDACVRVLPHEIELCDLPMLHELQRVTRGRTAADRHAQTRAAPARDATRPAAGARAAWH